jgi:putative transposase
MVEMLHPAISVRRQCELIGLNGSTLYYVAAKESEFNLHLMKLIDEQYTKTPFYGWPRMTMYLRCQGYRVNHKRVQRLMRKMGLEAIYPKPRTSEAASEHKIYPYLLGDLEIMRPNQVWSADITYVPLSSGFMYLVAVIDWFSRYVISWQLSNTLDGEFCVEALERSLSVGKPEIFNTDQGAQFTARAFTSVLETARVRISMDGRGRALDNVFVERLWRTVKYEDIYLRDYGSVPALELGLQSYFRFYNNERLHQSLGYQTPAQVHFSHEKEQLKLHLNSGYLWS